MWKKTPFGVYSQVEIDYVETPDPKIHHRYAFRFRNHRSQTWAWDALQDRLVQLSPEEEALERLLAPRSIDEGSD